jgi:hypothetical protein
VHSEFLHLNRPEGGVSYDRRLSPEELYEQPMTIIAAVHDGKGTVLVGADSAQMNSDNHSESASLELVDKLSRLGDHLLVWGWHGSDGQGDRIGAYLEASADAVDGWPSLVESAVAAVKRANSEGWIQTPNSRTQCLIAGLIGEEVGLLTVDADGRAKQSSDALFLGWGRVAALVGWRVSETQDASTSFQERFTCVMNTTIDVVVGLERPLSLWRVRSGECEPLASIESGP